MGGDYDGAYLCALLAPVDAVARPALAMQDNALTSDNFNEFAERALQAGHGMTKPASE
jgi:hypothetical protein